jgi:hypothetical protein
MDDIDQNGGYMVLKQSVSEDTLGRSIASKARLGQRNQVQYGSPSGI